MKQSRCLLNTEAALRLAITSDCDIRARQSYSVALRCSLTTTLQDFLHAAPATIDAHTIDGSSGNSRTVAERNLVRRIGPDGEDCEQTMDGGSN
jgi:hypothetical protein